MRFLAVLCAVALACPVAIHAEAITVSGKGEVPVAQVTKKDLPSANHRALAAAQGVARADAITQALFQVYGNRTRLGKRADGVIRSTVDHSASMILETQVRTADVREGKATVEVVLLVDAKAMREYLQNSLDISLTADAENKLRIYVLSYTIEGMDVDRAVPQVLKEEVTEDQKNVHSAAQASSEVKASAESNAAR